jgi:HD-GYP domain-containing protein (c-di-GMP phosphodiesterase class II)
VFEAAQRGKTTATAEGPGRYQLATVLHQNNKPVFVAAAGFLGIARTGADAEREVGWLVQWLQSVSDRLRLSDQLLGQKAAVDEQQALAKPAWEGLLALDRLVRRLRVYKDAEKNQQRIVEAAFEMIDAAALIYLPPHPPATAVTRGAALFTSEAYHELGRWLAKSPDFQEDSPLLYNAAQLKLLSWGQSFAGVESLLALPVLPTSPSGWLIALNKRSKSPEITSPVAFRRSDALVLLPFAALMRMQLGAANRYHELSELVVGMARSLTAALDAKDPYSFGHSERVARIGVELGHGLGLEGETLHDIYLAGLLHDIGYIGVPDEVMRKEEPLAPADFEQIKRHVTIGCTILAELRAINHLLPGVLHHHERWDGKGYPQGLAGEKIPLLARVLAVADAYDALSTARVHRPARPTAEIERILQAGAGTQWDPQVVAVFIERRHRIHALRQRGIGESLRQAIDGALNREGSTAVF